MNKIHRKVIIEDIKNVSRKLKKQRFSTETYFSNSVIKVSRRDIEKEFGSFANAMIASGLKPRKHHRVTNEQLFKGYEKALEQTTAENLLGNKGVERLTKLTNFSGTTYDARFGGLKNFLFEFKNWQMNKNRAQSVDKSIQDKNQVKPEVKMATDHGNNRQRYVGKAAENLVISELLFRDFNASLVQVDEGLDVFAVNTKNNKLYSIQVKHSYKMSEEKSRLILITLSSFERNAQSSTYYIFVISSDDYKRDFIILPFHKIDELLKSKLLGDGNDAKKITIQFIFREENKEVFINKVNDGLRVTRYLNAWDVLL